MIRSINKLHCILTWDESEVVLELATFRAKPKESKNKRKNAFTHGPKYLLALLFDFLASMITGSQCALQAFHIEFSLKSLSICSGTRCDAILAEAWDLDFNEEAIEATMSLVEETTVDAVWHGIEKGACKDQVK